MFQPTSAFSGFSVNDLTHAKAFYAETLGLHADDEGVGMRLHLPGGTAFAYPKDDHQPATFTILNFVVESIDEAVDELTHRGVQFEHYEEGPQTDQRASCAVTPSTWARISRGFKTRLAIRLPCYSSRKPPCLGIRGTHERSSKEMASR